MPLIRNLANPILRPDPNHAWEKYATFNPSVVKKDQTWHMFYRAMGQDNNQLSIIGHATSKDGIQFSQRQPLITPEFDWEQYGCEDPRVTFLDGKYYIFYTALSTYPFSAAGIKIGLAIFDEHLKSAKKYVITPFNSKAMALFPEKIDGKWVAILTVHTDIPPAKIAIAIFDKEEDMWSPLYWNEWYQKLDEHVIPVLRQQEDHVEIGSPPIKTAQGWLLFYAYIQKYFSHQKIFGIETLVLDSKHPQTVLYRSPTPLLTPEKDYECHGQISDVIFPSGACIEEDDLYLYYGAADQFSCLAQAKLSTLNLNHEQEKRHFMILNNDQFKRYYRNPIIAPRIEFDWEAYATYNAAAIYLDGAFHILYRAQSNDLTSRLGYAKSKDGIHIDLRLPYPAYEPRTTFEQKLRPGNSGCEDPRLTLLDNKLYLFYTAFDGYTPRVAFSIIEVKDFLEQRWSWSIPIVITPPHIFDKNACLLPEKIDDHYIVFHRTDNKMYLNKEPDLNFDPNKWLNSQTLLKAPPLQKSTFLKYGICAPPIKTSEGWLAFYHRIVKKTSAYEVSALLLDLNDPSRVLHCLEEPLLTPQTPFECVGNIANVIFPCGIVCHNELIYLYYGCADKVLSVAQIELQTILAMLLPHKRPI